MFKPCALLLLLVACKTLPQGATEPVRLFADSSPVGPELRSCNLRQVEAILRRHPTWVSVYFDLVVPPTEEASNQTNSPFGGAPRILVPIAKTWSVETENLQERTHLSFLESEGTNSAGDRVRRLRPMAEMVGLDEQLHLDVFGYRRTRAGQAADGTCSQMWTFYRLSGDAIEIRDGGTRRVVLIPDRIDGTPENVRQDVGVVTSPYGFNLDFDFLALSDYANADVEAAKPARYLRHDLRRSKPVYFDRSFPRAYVDVAARTLAAWNRALAAEFFAVDREPRQLSPAECYAKSWLCIFWFGPADGFNWSQPGGLTMPAFNPGTGEIGGGVIVVSTSAKISMDQPEQLVAAKQLVDDASTSVEAHARLLNVWVNWSNYEVFNVEVPAKAEMVTFTMLHELGHYLGLLHHFAASTAGTIAAPTKSVMDYPPHLFRLQVQDLKPWDLALINFLYRGAALSDDYQACADLDLAPALHDGVRGKNINCLRWDVGDAVEWLIAFAQAGIGVESSLAPLGLCTARRGLAHQTCDVLHELGLVLSETSTGASQVQKRRARQFLCGLQGRDRLLQTLERDLRVSVDCSSSR